MNENWASWPSSLLARGLHGHGHVQPKHLHIVVPPIGEDDGAARAAFIDALLDAALEDAHECVAELDDLLGEADDLIREIHQRSGTRPRCISDGSEVSVCAASLEAFCAHPLGCAARRLKQENHEADESTGVGGDGHGWGLDRSEG